MIAAFGITAVALCGVDVPDSRGGRYYETNQYGMDRLQQAVNDGYERGRFAIIADRQDRWAYNYGSRVGAEFAHCVLSPMRTRTSRQDENR